MNIKEFLRQRSAERKERKREQRKKYWQKRAKEVITVGYNEDGIVVMFCDTPIYWVSNETNMENGTITLEDLNDEIARLRGCYFRAHEDKEIDL